MLNVLGSEEKKTAKTQKQKRDTEKGSMRKRDGQNSRLQEKTLTTDKEAQKREESATSIEGHGSSRYSTAYKAG
ncbi:hypothetical protein NDU88_004151 [Pleurodeles waltl]|uniref:Uncharacterized protein n=1 Tax=Pleurodeles waltl TaxID=8319 RepID=A0AAV7T7J4_PLEWA|nr:hypothetical protein NDU88_004151 [Pleurodeles waltl]